MTVKQYIYALVDNILAQINADQRHKTTYTTLYIQHMLVSHINALAAVGVIESTPEICVEAWEMLSEKLKLAGLAAVEAALDPAGVGTSKILDLDGFPWVLDTP